MVADEDVDNDDVCYGNLYMICNREGEHAVTHAVRTLNIKQHNTLAITPLMKLNILHFSLVYSPLDSLQEVGFLVCSHAYTKTMISIGAY